MDKVFLHYKIMIINRTEEYLRKKGWEKDMFSIYFLKCLILGRLKKQGLVMLCYMVKKGECSGVDCERCGTTMIEN